MKKLIINETTRRQLEQFAAVPAQVLILAGPEGSGKLSVARGLAEEILKLNEGGFADYAHALLISPVEGKTIGIEAARQIEKFLRLKVPGGVRGESRYDRAVIIENGHLMTAEAQNALLKTLEEPPAGTVIIITVSYEPALLPTVRSRSQTITMQRPQSAKMEQFFAAQGYDAGAIRRAHNVSGGQIGLMQALLSDQDHPLRLATEQARLLLSQPAYERLITIDSLAKDKTLATNTVSIMQRMARLSLQTASGAAAKKWQTILEASYAASEALELNGQPKLALTKLVLQF